eukprot:2366463-Prymnesium_polylepis.1
MLGAASVTSVSSTLRMCVTSARPGACSTLVKPRTEASRATRPSGRCSLPAACCFLETAGRRCRVARQPQSGSPRSRPAHCPRCAARSTGAHGSRLPAAAFFSGWVRDGWA